jgi:hypothetical protein
MCFFFCSNEQTGRSVVVGRKSKQLDSNANPFGNGRQTHWTPIFARQVIILLKVSCRPVLPVASVSFAKAYFPGVTAGTWQCE